MAKFREQMISILDRYIEEVNEGPTALDDVVDWALAQGLYRPEPRDIRKAFKEALAESLRQEKRFDGKRWYRAKHSIRSNVGGVQLNLWADIDRNASLTFMEKSISERRRGMVNDAFQTKQDVDHFNEANPDQRQISLVLDLTDDVAEMEAARSAEKKDDEEAA